MGEQAPWGLEFLDEGGGGWGARSEVKFCV